MHSWNDARNAELYDLFTRKHRLYPDTSRDLVDLAKIQNSRLVVDLACGTGVATEAILERLGPAARVVAIDGSPAMLQVAQRRVPDARVRWVIADGSGIAVHVQEADAILCNSAIWQMEMAETLFACAQALRPGGRLVFNIGRGYLRDLPVEREPQPAKPTLPQIMLAIAVRDHGYAPPATASKPTSARARLTLDGIEKLLTDAGLVPDATEEKGYDEPAEALLDWFSVPVFSDNVLIGMPYEQQRIVIAEAYQRFDKDSTRTRKLFLFAAHKP